MAARARLSRSTSGGPLKKAKLDAGPKAVTLKIPVDGSAPSSGATVQPEAQVKECFPAAPQRAFTRRGGDGTGNSVENLIPLTSSTFLQDQALANYSSMKMRSDVGSIDSRPLLVCTNGYIVLETMTALSREAEDFLIAVSEPVSRPEFIREYQITVFSLYAALSMGIVVEEIVENLQRFAKNELPELLKKALYFHGQSFGKVKLVLRNGTYIIESPFREELEYILRHPVIADSRIRKSLTSRQIVATGLKESIEEPHLPPPPASSESVEKPKSSQEDFTEETLDAIDPSTLDFVMKAASKPVEGAEGSKPGEAIAPAKKRVYRTVFSFEIQPEKVNIVKEAALRDLKRPLLTEYDFRRDSRNPTLEIALKPTTKIRYYQESALRKMFSDGRARSGIIVLPCGAGKTLTGITAVTTVKKSAMVLTSSSVAVDQWRRSFSEFTTVDTAKVLMLTSDSKVSLPAKDEACVVCSTYTMMAYSGKRSEAASRIVAQIQEREWGVLIFDEVQFAPAPAFRRINDLVKSHCKLGLTATLVREDDLISDLQWLIGPKLDEANWLDLQQAGFLAKVKCSEVWCPMTYEYYKAYLNSPPMKQRKLWVCNPNKLRTCEYLIRFHEERRDKIIVFSDNLFALKELAFTLKKPYISGEVSLQERMIILNKFKSSPNFSTIILSKVGDNAIDIPCANVVIQISFNFASRRQEAQRLGRLLRPKGGSATAAAGNNPSVPEGGQNGTAAAAPVSGYNAFFYSLISKDTQEMAYADKRQQFIIDQGYAYKVLPMAVFPMNEYNLVYDNAAKHRALLQQIMLASESNDTEEDDVALNSSSFAGAGDAILEENEGEISQSAVSRITASNLAALSGGRSKRLYFEAGSGGEAARQRQKRERPY